jgi:single-strand DNA-binding protein
MNKVILIGRLAADPEARSIAGDKPLTITRYRLAVDREFKKGEADFLPITAFGKAGEFADKYFRKGMRVAVVGRIQITSYKNKNGDTVWKTDIVAESQEFCESKKESSTDEADNFMPADGYDLPFC